MKNVILKTKKGGCRCTQCGKRARQRLCDECMMEDMFYYGDVRRKK